MRNTKAYSELMKLGVYGLRALAGVYGVRLPRGVTVETASQDDLADALASFLSTRRYFCTEV